MPDGISITPKPKFPWPLAFRMGKDMTTNTLGFWLCVGAFALPLQWADAAMGLGGDMLLLAALALFTTICQHVDALWELALPHLERWLARKRIRLGL